jgi:acetate kinase
MIVLVINAGSSSLKYLLIETDTEDVLAKGTVERVGIEGSKLTQKSPKGEFVIEAPMANHTDAMRYTVAALTDGEKGVIADMSSIKAVGHRVLHGGEKFSASVVVDDAVLDAIRENIPLGPLHNPANLQGIVACQQIMPGVPQVAVFDTAFHQTMPAHAFMYALPYEYYEKYHVRRYGFHGTSHRFVSAKVAELCGKKKEDLRTIVCHLGNGSSVSAVAYGKCVDTSMGITPLEGLMMGTRSGDMDPAITEYLMHNTGLSIEEITNVYNKKSGMLGISGVSSDMRDLHAAVNAGNARAALALEMVCYRITKYVGAFAAAMGGVDVIAFTGGIGENDAVVRQKVMANLGYMNASIDEAKNEAENHKQVEITGKDSKVRVWVVNTNEELAIARDTVELVAK